MRQRCSLGCCIYFCCRGSFQFPFVRVDYDEPAVWITEVIGLLSDYSGVIAMVVIASSYSLSVSHRLLCRTPPAWRIKLGPLSTEHSHDCWQPCPFVHRYWVRVTRSVVSAGLTREMLIHTLYLQSLSGN